MLCLQAGGWAGWLHTSSRYRSITCGNSLTRETLTTSTGIRGGWVLWGGHLRGRLGGRVIGGNIKCLGHHVVRKISETTRLGRGGGAVLLGGCVIRLA